MFKAWKINVLIFKIDGFLTWMKPIQSFLQDFSSSSWEDRLADNGEEDDGDITDPELIAEKEYALEHGTELGMNSVDGRGLSMTACGDAECK